MGKRGKARELAQDSQESMMEEGNNLILTMLVKLYDKDANNKLSFVSEVC